MTNKETDYVIKSGYPLDYEVLSSLLELEWKQRESLDNLYFEFDTLPLSGRQIVNLSNNLNVNVTLMNPTDEQMGEMLAMYSTSSIRKTVYPVKIVVLVSLMILYGRVFLGKEIKDDISAEVAELVQRVKFDYIDGKFDNEFITKWVQWQLVYWFEQQKGFIESFREHCMYLFEYAYKYYKNIPIKRPTTNELSSGLCVPLAFVMRDLRFNPYRHASSGYKFNYVPVNSGGIICEALGPLINYVTLVEEYEADQGKKEFFVEDLEKLTEAEVVALLKEKKKIITKNPVSKLDLFPLEITKVCSL